MKFLAVFLIFGLAHCQTVTEDLVAAQNDLTIGHEFGELFLVQNREILSNYLAIIEQTALDHFMGAYASIKNLSLETREAMAEFTEPALCTNHVRARYELQVTRFGQRLSQCLGETNGYLVAFTSILNALHHESRSYTNMIPNTSVNVLSRINIFTGRDNLRTYINNDYRDLFFRARDFHNDFETFIGGISIDLESLIEQHTECYRTLPAAFVIESAADLAAIAAC